MSGFTAIALALTALVVFWVARPLLRNGLGAEVGLRESALTVHRQHLVELEIDRANGLLSAEQLALARLELERRVLDEAAADGDERRLEAKGARIAAVALITLIPSSALLVHYLIDQHEPRRLLPTPVEQRDGDDAPKDLLAGLAARLEKEPGDSRGWQLLARSYVALERLPEAVAAFERAAQLVRDDPDLYADFADAIATSQGRRIDSRALELVERALRIDPNHAKALSLAGTAAFNRKDYRGAIEHWEKLRALLPADSAMAKSLAGAVAEARDLGGSPAAQAMAPPAATVSGRVTLSPRLSARVDGHDTLFVVARAASGPRTPLAVLRLRVADLPVDFALDDALSMTPGHKLSAFAEVVVSARITRSGSTIAQRGDLHGSSPPVKVGANAVAIVIDSEVQ